MGLRVATNVPSLNAQRNLDSTSAEQSKALSRLSSGNRITTAGDDAAGLSISQNLEAQVRGLKQARRNANDGTSLVQTAEGALNEISNNLVRLRELGVQAASDTVGNVERGFINQEYQSLMSEIDRVAQSTNFNGTKLLSGEGDKLTLQVGAFAGASNQIVYDTSYNDVRTSNLEMSGVDVTSRQNAEDSLAKVDAAINKVNGYRAGLGAMQSRLQSTSNSLGIAIENLSEAKSRIADADLAVETSNLTKANILHNAGIAVLAQANATPTSALKLL